MPYTNYGPGSTGSTSVDRPGAVQPMPQQQNTMGGQGQLIHGGQSDVPNWSGLSNYFDLYNKAMQPSLIEGQNQLDQNAAQLSLTDQMSLMQAQQAQQSAGFQQQGLGLDRQGLGIQQGALTRQMELLPQQFSLQNQGFDLSQQQANYGAMTGMRDLNSAQTARGAFTSQGANAHRGDINQNLAFATQGIGLQRQGAGLNFKEQQAQQQDAQKELGLQSQRLGLSAQEIGSRLDNALSQLGIQNQVSRDQLLSEAAKVRQGMTSPLEGLFAHITDHSGVPLISGGAQ